MLNLESLNESFQMYHLESLRFALSSCEFKQGRLYRPRDLLIERGNCLEGSRVKGWLSRLSPFYKRGVEA